MSNNARQNTVVGLFAIAAIAMVVAVLLYFGGDDPFWKKRLTRDATVIFTGSVKGLNVGAPVTLRGVQVGEVRSIDVRFDVDALEYYIPVRLRVRLNELDIKPAALDPGYLETLIERGLRAQLRTQSLLTGLLYVDLDFQPDTVARFMDYPTDSVQLPTTPTEFEEILQRVSSLDLQSLIQHLDETVQHAGALLSDPQMRQLPSNLNTTLTAVQQLSENLDKRTASMTERLDGLALKADGTMQVADVEIRQTGDRVRTSLAQVDATLAGIDRLVAEADYSLSDSSPILYQLNETLVQLTQAARALEALAVSLEMHPEALIRGKQEMAE